MKKKGLLAILLTLALIIGMVPLAMSAFAYDYVAKIGTTNYESLEAAFTNVKNGETITLLKNCAGNGLKGVVADAKTITIDFAGFTYTMDGSLVGSSGTVKQGFHFEKGWKVTLKGGTYKIANVNTKMAIQNYCDLTIQDMTIDASAGLEGQYAISNNCGTVKILGKTSITAPSNGVAIEAAYWPSSYAEGTKVTVDTTGTITGRIETGIYGSKGDNTGFLTQAQIDDQLNNKKSNLTIENGNFVGTITRANGISSGTAWKATNDTAVATALLDTILTIKGGTFSAEPATGYIADGYKKLAAAGNKTIVTKTVEDETKAEEVNEDTVTPIIEDTANDVIADVVAGNETDAVSDETAEAILEAVKDGKEISTELVVEEVSADGAAVKDNIVKMETVAPDGTKVVQYFEIEVLVKADGDEIGTINKLNEKVTLTIDIPKAFQNANGTYAIVRVHNGKAENLKGTVDKTKWTITFQTDSFSAYALVSDVEAPAKDTKNRTNPNTGV